VNDVQSSSLLRSENILIHPDKIVDMRIAASRPAPSGNNLLRDESRMKVVRRKVVEGAG